MTRRHAAGGQADLTVCAESSVDAAGPGRQAIWACPPVRYPATAEVGGRSVAQAARGPRSPLGLGEPGYLTRPAAPGEGRAW
jgi:hypothetical protein